MMLIYQADELLRGEKSSAARLHQLLLIATLSGLAYGAAMGTFSGLWGGKILQIVYSSLKVPILLSLTALLTLPSFFVFNTLAGLRDDFAAALRALMAAQAALAVVLVSLAPLTMFWYASSADYQSAVRYNALMFAIASFAGQFVLRREYAELIRRNTKHKLMLRLWLVVYIFVGIQMGWVLRPFIGDPTILTRFFREDAWGNAYVIVLGKLFGGH